MNLKEYEGEALFARYGIPVPRSFIAGDVDDAAAKLRNFSRKEKIFDFMIKAQVASGRRGKAGGVAAADLHNFRKVYKSISGSFINGQDVEEVMVAERIRIKREFYLGMAVNRSLRRPVLIFSTEGGIDIEETGKKSPSKIHKLVIANPDIFPGEKLSLMLAGCGIGSEKRRKIISIAGKLHKLFSGEDCLLAEINPLVCDEAGNFYAVDAKVVTDGEALFRHPERKSAALRGLTAAEKKAHKYGLSYVELLGHVAVVGNGAGLVMATLDRILDEGMAPANFCDVGGGASSMMMEEALETVLGKRNVKSLLINIFGGITRCDDVAKGILIYIKENKIKIPMVVRLTGTGEKEALKILKDAGIRAAGSLNAAIGELKKMQ